ncbi:Protein of unknown function [Pyronema omphalodes CBS 100304]|uniref:Uncharacterized protein n=1 Tax=Pyronema omphalodes (strain CBS 100304) TaxID=1076935 RepID=U4LPZ0_PYROM|nr:Protein of unknown function [Pyronema omphalodes CBS 100304]
MPTFTKESPRSSYASVSLSQQSQAQVIACPVPTLPLVHHPGMSGAATIPKCRGFVGSLGYGLT